MSSPVQISFARYIQIDRDSLTPMYLQVVHQYIQAVQNGFLVSGQKLPGSRVLAEHLQIHRKTVISALDELEAQGWIEVRPSVGSFVLVGNNGNFRKTKANSNQENDGYPRKTNYPISQSTLLEQTEEGNTLALEFTDGQTDIRLSNTRTLMQAYSANMKRGKEQQMSELSHLRSKENALESISTYIHVGRGIRSSISNIIHTRSREMGLFSVAQTLIKKGDLVLIADLSYYRSNMIFQQVGARLRTIPMDEYGLDTAYIRRHFRKYEIRCLYLSTQQHYPNTVVLSNARRMELLDLAAELEFAIIEDDSECDFQYERSTNLPLCSSDQMGSVIYIGALGRFLSPNFQTGLIIAPKNFIRECRKYIQLIDPLMDTVLQRTLAEMIDEGDMHRYHKRALKAYKARRDHFAQLAQMHLGDYFDFQVPKGGLAFWFVFKSRTSVLQFKDLCTKEGLHIPLTCLYQNQHFAALRLGFGHLNEDELSEAVRCLERSAQLCKQSSDEASNFI